MNENDAVFGTYKIEIELDKDNAKFIGKVSIDIENRKDDLYLDLDEIEIGKVQVDGKEAGFKIINGGKAVEIKTGPGVKHVSINYTGTVNDRLSGLYRAKYSDGLMLTTQFESTGARRVFPCADNPSSKAVFQITLIIDASRDAISNMPIISEEVRPDGMKAVRFQETPRMSTYLIYLGIGNFSTRSQKSGKTEIILTAPKGHLTDSNFPIEITSEVLKRFNKYFGIDYVLPKVHIISVPEFGAGAMENWGAITFREIYLSIGKSTSQTTYKATAEVIAHELAHQWFGNLVTMKWWNDLWLNESFATFMSYKVIQEIRESWNPVGDQIFLRTEGALRNDSFTLTHPIDARVADPSEIAEIFDEISYGKGSSILRMIETYMGPGNFRKGIMAYLEKFKYSNAEGKDLWKSLETESGMEISRVMEKWIREEGYPLIEVSISGNRIRLRQGRFYGIGRVDWDKTWPIPLVVKRGQKYESRLFEEKEMEIDSEGVVSLNGNSAGFYRIHPSREAADLLMGNAVNMNEFESYNFLSDNFAMFSAGMVSFDEYNRRMKAFWNLEKPLVIREIARELDLLITVSGNAAVVSKTVEGFYRIHRNMKKEDPADPNIKIAYNSLLSLYSRTGNEFRKEMSSRFDSFFEQEPESRAMIARAYAAENGSSGKIIGSIEKSENDEDRVKLIGALAWLKDGSELQKGYDYVLGGGIKKQDLPAYFLNLGTNIWQRQFFNSHFMEILKKLESVFESSRTTTRTMENTLPFSTLDGTGSLDIISGAEGMSKYEKTINRVREMREIYSNIRNALED
ncbi:MAG: M1 family metallopeptidase [Candidatus Thermoplasmatota archaeon]|nr:M1 family metallopeptidase [Candidatus Thermoplasmatota archaeon]MCL5791061.1 M1 family metallopeptidase [Candidatus Thermoplasmatota archaeon]